MGGIYVSRDYAIEEVPLAKAVEATKSRGFLRKILPGRFQVSTGFIEDCNRQLDIIVWDGTNYAPFFRENEVVVLPRTSVRAIFEFIAN